MFGSTFLIIVLVVFVIFYVIPESLDPDGTLRG